MTATMTTLDMHNLGERVRTVEAVGGIPRGVTGVIHGVNWANRCYCVVLDEPCSGTHTCDGRYPAGNALYLRPYELVPLDAVSTAPSIGAFLHALRNAEVTA